MQAVQRPQGNIAEGPQNQRMRVGVIAFMITLVGAVAMQRLGVHPLARVALVLPFFVASNGVYMGLFGT